MNIRMKVRIVALIAALLLQIGNVWAHPPGLSSIYLQQQLQQLDVRVTFALQDIEAFAPMDSDLDAEVSDAERDAAKPRIAKLLSEQLKLMLDGHPLVLMGPGQVSFDEQNNAHVDFQYALP